MTFFAHLESDANTGGAELRLLIDCDQGLVGLPLHLGAWSLAESLDRTISTAARNATSAGLPGLPVPDDARQTIREQAEPMVSLLLYLCSQAGEVGLPDPLGSSIPPNGSDCPFGLLPSNRASNSRTLRRIAL